MSRLLIEHNTIYSYHRPVSFGRHRLVIRPREGHDLRVESMKLSISPGHELLWARDVFNNSVAIVDFHEAASQLEVRSSVVVQRCMPFPSQDPEVPCRISLPVEYDVLEVPVAAAYQTISYPDDLTDVRAWLKQLSLQTDAESLLQSLCELIHTHVKYQRRHVKGVQTPAQTLKLQSGSCRDMATLMMDAARMLGLSARFASGYLDCPASEAGRASTHAWTEIYLPILGWRGFDPTLGEPTSLKHIVVGVSNHPRGVMPISGVFNGSSADYIDMVAQVKIDKLSD